MRAGDVELFDDLIPRVFFKVFDGDAKIPASIFDHVERLFDVHDRVGSFGREMHMIPAFTVTDKDAVFIASRDDFIVFVEVVHMFTRSNAFLGSRSCGVGP